MSHIWKEEKAKALEENGSMVLKYTSSNSKVLRFKYKALIKSICRYNILFTFMVVGKVNRSLFSIDIKSR